MPQSYQPDTSVVHAGQQPEPVTGAVMPPVFLSTTYAQDSPGVHKGLDYIRAHNPTRYAFERMVAKLEGSEIPEEMDPSCGGFAFASGMAAMCAALDLIDANSHVVAMDDMYGGSNRLFQQVRRRTQGLALDFVDLTDAERLRGAMRADTALIWLETPTNPTLKLADIAAVSRIAKSVNPDVLVVVDNTFATPLLQNPLQLGADIVMHSVTKYLGGHSDVLGGVLATADPALAERLRYLQLCTGGVMAPFDAYLALRGVKTLGVRMARHNESAMRIARFLESHDAIERVVYPGLESHPQHELAKRQMRGFTGMITCFLKGGLPEARRFLESVHLFALAESLGGVESLVEHPAIMTHASVPPDMRAELGISDSLVRFSVGIEDADDLIADIETGLAAAMQGAPATV